MEGTPVLAIVTHPKPHLDEIVAIWLLRKFGADFFPSAESAQIVLLGKTFPGSQNNTDDHREKEGILFLGVGGGRFDEHPVGNGAKKEGCAATLVAKSLGVDQKPELRQILKYVTHEDTKGGGQTFDLATLVKSLNERFPNDHMRVIEWAVEALEAKFAEQEQFHQFSPESWRNIAVVENIQGEGGRTYKLVTVTSDSSQAPKYARSSQGGKADIVIVRRSTGHVQIFTNKQAGICLDNTIRMIRILEQEKKGVAAKDIDLATLAHEGKIPAVPEWFYHHEGQMLLNGSLTALDVPPTSLSLDKIKGAVRVGISSNGSKIIAQWGSRVNH